MKSLVRLVSLALVFSYSLVISAPAVLAADVRISEVHANPDVPLVGGSADVALETFREWVEIQNTTPEALSLNGLKLRNSSGPQDYAFSASATIPANGRYVVCRNSTPLTNGLVNCNATWAWTNPLPNSTATVSLLTAGNEVIDSATITNPQNGVSTEIGVDGTQTPATTPYNLAGERGTPGTALDTTAPSAPTSTVPSPLYGTTDQITTLSWTAVTDPSAPVTYIYQVASSPDKETGGSFTAPLGTINNGTQTTIPTPNTPAGVYYWHVRALDNAGNTSAWSDTYVVYIDNVAPNNPVCDVPSVITPSNDNTVDATWPSGSDDISGVKGYSYSFTQDEFGDPGTTVMTDTTGASSDPLADGTWYLRIRTIDNANNASSPVTCGKYEIDTTAPTVTVDTLTTSNKSPRLSGTTDDPAATVKVKVNNVIYDAVNKGDGTWELAANTIEPALNVGTYEVAAEAADSAGNVGADGTSNELKITMIPNVVTGGLGGGFTSTNTDISIAPVTKVIVVNYVADTAPGDYFTPASASQNGQTSSSNTNKNNNTLGAGATNVADTAQKSKAWLWWIVALIAILGIMYAIYRTREDENA